jgi:hypothetical protein
MNRICIPISAKTNEEAISELRKCKADINGSNGYFKDH